MKWQPIETAPKQIVSRRSLIADSDKQHEFGPHVLLWPVYGEVARGRWWQAEHYSNWLCDGGTAVQPTHWKPLPEPPK